MGVKAALTLLVEVERAGMQKPVVIPSRKEWVADCQQAQKTHFAAQNWYIRQRAGETAACMKKMNKACGRDVCYVTTIIRCHNRCGANAAGGL